MLTFLRIMSIGIRFGLGFSSKVKIVISSIIYIIKWIFPNQVAWTDRIINFLSPDFSNVVIKNDGVYYKLIDTESFFLISFLETWMKKYLEINKGDVFIDIGAHIGKYSLRYSAVARKIIAIEADPDNYEGLRHNIKLNGITNITTINTLAWDKSTFKNFYKTYEKGGGTVKKRLPERKYLGEYIKLKAEPMDNVLESLGVEKVDWIKIDVEGAEYEVLNGLDVTLMKHKPRIVAEIMKSNREKVLKYMKKKGYTAEPIRESDSPTMIYYRFEPLANMHAR